MSKQGINPVRKGPRITHTEVQIVSDSTIKSALENLITSAKVLAADQSVGRALELINKISELEANVVSKDGQIKSLQDELEKGKANHEDVHQQSLRTYDAARDKLKSQLHSSETQVAALNSELEKKNATITSLKDIQTEQNDTAKKLEEANGRVEALVQSLEESKEANEQLKKAIQQKKNKLSQSETALKTLQNSHEKLEKQHQVTEQQMRDAQSLRVELSSEESEPKLRELDQLWPDALDLFCSFFLKDVPDYILQNDPVWYRLKSPRYWSHSLPIPQSNSPAAKHMRIAVILTSIAHAVDRYIFQPTYFLPPGHAFRDLLARQAQGTAAQESALRAVVQALLPQEQEAAIKKRVQETSDEIMLDIGGLIPSEGVASFKANLSNIVEEAAYIWQDIQRYEEFVNPSFTLTSYSNWAWNQLCFEDGRVVFRGETQSASADSDEPMFAIFPRLNIVDGNEIYPMTHGVLLMKSQTLAAREEMEQQPPSPGVGRTKSILTRNPKPRKHSTAGQPKSDEAASQSFLDRQSLPNSGGP